jgi:Fur family ferric uptake transcriptional regulator
MRDGKHEPSGGIAFGKVFKKATRQRELIADVFFKLSTHRSADEIWKEVKKREPRLSLATVYRTLKALEKAG